MSYWIESKHSNVGAFTNSQATEIQRGRASGTIEGQLPTSGGGRQPNARPHEVFQSGSNLVIRQKVSVGKGAGSSTKLLKGASLGDCRVCLRRDVSERSLLPGSFSPRGLSQSVRHPSAAEERSQNHWIHLRQLFLMLWGSKSKSSCDKSYTASECNQHKEIML